MTGGAGSQASRVPLALAALTLGAFTVGSAELVVVGILPLVAGDLSVGTGPAGLLVSAYALGIAAGGTALTAATLRVRRRPLLLATLALYAVATAGAALAGSFALLLVARAITGGLHGLFMGAALTLAASLVPPERMGRALSAVFGGIALATMLGVPLGRVIGEALGWRATFAAILAMAVVSLALAAATVPGVARSGPTALRQQGRAALAPRVLAVLPLGFLLMGGQFAALTFLTPFLADVTGLSSGWISLALVGYGIANAVGNVVGGWAADRDVTGTLIAVNVVLIVVLVAVAAGRASPVVVGAALLVWGLAGFAFIPAFQHRVTGLAGAGRDLAAILAPAAVTSGIAAGAAVGGWAVSESGPTAAMVTGLAICAATLPLTWATRRLTA